MLRDVLREVRPDALIVVGDDQNEQFGLDQMLTFCIHRGASIEVKKRPNGSGASTMPGSGQWDNMAWQEASRAGESAAPPTFPPPPISPSP